MSYFGYYFDRYMVAHQTVVRKEAGWKQAEETKSQCLAGMERAIGDEVEQRMMERLRDLRLIPVGGDEE